MTRHAHVTGGVLAGGRARRSGGREKGRLPLGGDPGDHCLARIRRVFEGRFDRKVMVLAADADPAGGGVDAREGWHMTRDRFEGCGPLGGLHAGLDAVTTPSAFVCGADMPSICGPLIDLMIARARPDRPLVPLRGGRPEPLHAVYPAGCAGEAGEALREGVRMMTDFFARIAVDYLEEGEYLHLPGAAASFENINTPSDLDRVRRGGGLP